ncbi:hypothetical protein AMTRI_Chr02g215930 [Amborella trichopoda]|uniref:Uncharacterized protein n=1 Tax=Amborella trichopoda TaxID=13333 RepID=U5DAE1_AMBTC|nr:hypothetical protein AMTR_s00037p00161660 [Amborella trichopoda]
MGECYSKPSQGNGREAREREAEEDGSRRLGERCISMAREKRSRLYIASKCAAMLLCWHEHASDRDTSRT